MYILLFEKLQVNLTSGSKDHAVSVRNLMSVAFQNSITPDTKQVKQNYLNILKSAAIHGSKLNLEKTPHSDGLHTYKK